VRVKKNIIDKAIEAVSPSWGMRRAENRMRIALASNLYRGASTDRLRSDWPVLLTKDNTPQSFELDRLRVRSRDLNRNDPVAAGAMDTMCINIVGRGLIPQSQIRAEVLGATKEQARQWQKTAERVWALWTPAADSANRLTFNEVQFLALRKIIEDGEILALPVWVKEPWRQMGRAIELIEADRLGGNYSKEKPTYGMGIEVGEQRGEPQRYWIKKANYQNIYTDKTEYTGIPARDADGRPMVLHVFPQRRPGQLRGVPFFAPVLNYFKDLSDYLEAEVVAARVAACLAVFITKTDPVAAAYGNQTGTESSTNSRLQNIEPGLVHYLGIGEGINIVDPKRPGETFDAFLSGVLRLIGNALGMPYEIFFKDFSKTNYSSARAALLEGRRSFLNWRGWFAEKFCQPVYELVLEEAYLRGLFDVPDFYANRAEYCRCQWVGGGWGWVDPTKEVEASKMAIDYGLSTMAEEAAGQGRDWEELLEQRAREQEKVRELGVDIASPGGTTKKEAKNDEQDTEAEERQRAGAA